MEKNNFGDLHSNEVDDFLLDNRENNPKHTSKRNTKITELKLGTSCNNNCTYCLNCGSSWDLSFDEVKDKIDFFVDSGIRTISITGGEPTIRKDFFKILDYMKSKGVSIIIHTNGRALNYDYFVDKLAEYPVILFLVSLPAHNPELYRKLCMTDGFNQVVNGIKNLFTRGMKVSINCVISKGNVDFIPEIVKHHAALCPDTLQLGWVSPKGKALESFDSQVPDFRENVKYLFEALDWLDENFKGHVSTLGIPYCVLGKYSFFKSIEYDGQVKLSKASEISVKHNSALQDKMKTASCKYCMYENTCEGIFREFISRFGSDYVSPVSKLSSRYLVVGGFIPEDNNDGIPNYGAYRVTNDLLSSLEKSDKVDKILYFVPDDIYKSKKHRQSSRIKIFPLSSIKKTTNKYEQNIVAAYCINRYLMKTLENLSFKKIALIHSQDSPDLLEEYARYVFECNKNNCFFVSPSLVGKDVALNIFKEFEKHKGTEYTHRVVVIPWGIKELNNKTNPKFIEPYTQKIKLLYFGRIDSTYKADLLPLLKMVKDLQKIYIGLELHLAGKINSYELSRLKPFLSDSILYDGQIPEAEKLDFIAKHDVLISPVNSIQETFGVSLLEGASQGLVCLGSRWNGHDEILKDESLFGISIKPFSINIPAGIKHIDWFFKEGSGKISQNILVDWSDCKRKLISVINNFDEFKSKGSLKKDINHYLWRNLIKKHEELWFSKDTYIKDVVSEYIADLSVPVKIFFR